MKKILLLACSVFVFLSAMAYDFESNGFYYNIISLSDLTAELTCSGVEDAYDNETATYCGDITIPQTTEYANKTFRVIRINSFAFINCSIGTLTIPETIESVGGDDLVTYGLYGSFMNLVIEDSDNPIRCSRCIVRGNVSNSVYLGREFEVVGGLVNNPFSGNGGSYKTITFGDKLTKIPFRCCYKCQNLTEITLPANVKTIEGSAFYGCSSLASINCENIEEIGSGAFGECSSLKTISGASVEVLRSEAFINCSALESFAFPKLKIIENAAFASCTSLRDAVLPSGVVGIYGDEYGGVFDGCTSLESISIPSTIVKIGNAGDWHDINTKIFVGCTSLKTISIANPSPIQLAESNFDMMTYLSATLKVPVGAKDAYSQAAGWKNFSTIEEDASLKGDIFTVFYDEGDPYYGSLEIDFEDALDAFEHDIQGTNRTDKYRFAAQGSTITIDVKPERDYKLESLIVNGEDVTANVESDVYSFVVTGSVTISASFEYDDNPEPEVPIFLSIKQADGGCVKMRVYKWDSYGFIIEPTEGWRVHSVTFNGVDVTDYVHEDGTFYTPDITDNSEMVVAFEKIDNSIEHRSASQARVTASSGNVIVTGANSTEEIFICNESGVVVANAMGNGTNQTFPMPDTGIYIVKVGEKTVKLSL